MLIAFSRGPVINVVTRPWVDQFRPRRESLAPLESRGKRHFLSTYLLDRMAGNRAINYLLDEFLITEIYED